MIYIKKWTDYYEDFFPVEPHQGEFFESLCGEFSSPAKILSVESIKRGIPLIIVDRYYRGVASYLDSIRQEVVVLFDEFDKTFGEVRAGDDCASPQAELLTLFDGVSTGKKLYDEGLTFFSDTKEKSVKKASAILYKGIYAGEKRLSCYS